jgi:hypothetical protein
MTMSHEEKVPYPNGLTVGVADFGQDGAVSDVVSELGTFRGPGGTG